MDIATRKQQRRRSARGRIRRRIRGDAERPRLAVFKSGRYVYAQLIDDLEGHTLIQANSAESGLQGKLEAGTSSKAAARLVGETIAERAKEAGIARCVFDRSGYRYHGRVKELAEGARAQGLDF